jgi:hypothetical protein
VTKKPVTKTSVKKSAPVKKPAVVKKPVAKKPVVTKKYRVGEVAPLDPKDPGAQSKCVTPKMKAMYAGAVSQMEKDIASKGKGFPKASGDYRTALELTWDAMNQPYCGTGTKGMTAVANSFQKTINRTRADFMKRVAGKPEISESSSPDANISSSATITP